MRRTIMGAWVLVVLSQAALAVDEGSVITYTLGLGGDNHADLYENPQAPNYYPQFDTSVAAYTENDGQTFGVTENLTWSVKVAVTGVYKYLSGSLNYTPNGAANLAFSLELRHYVDQQEGSLAGDVVFHSTINDGDDDGSRGQLLGADPLHWAAFAFTYSQITQYVSGVPTKPGRIIDTIQNGGPGLTAHQYPSRHGEATDPGALESASVLPGQLVGMGAGYPEYVPAELIDSGEPWSDYFFGVGMSELTYWGYDGLGAVPIAEGQMDTRNLRTGTYILKLMVNRGTANNNSSFGNNILRGDYDPDWDYIYQYADRASEVVESSIIFFHQAPPAIIAAQSLRTHGTAGTFGIDILMQNAIEPRANGPAEIRIVFDQTVVPTDGTLDSEVSVSSGSVGTLSLTQTNVSNDTLVVPMATAPDDRACLTIDIAGLADASNTYTMIPATLKVVCLKGEINAQVPVNLLDLSLVKAALCTTATSDNFRRDVAADGNIDLLDLSAVKANLFQSAVCP